VLFELSSERFQFCRRERDEDKVRRSEVSRCQDVEASSLSRRVYFTGNLEDAIPRGIEGGEYARLGVVGPGIEFEERGFIKEKRNFDRVVVAPKADAMPIGIVAATLIWKVEGHLWELLLAGGGAQETLLLDDLTATSSDRRPRTFSLGIAGACLTGGAAFTWLFPLLTKDFCET